MWTIKITSEKYIQIGSKIPDERFTFYGWEFEPYYILGLIPCIIYRKKLFNNK